MATAQISLENGDQAFIDQAITKHSGRPGELLGILEAVFGDDDDLPALQLVHIYTRSAFSPACI